MSEPLLQAQIICPNCGHRKTETMPINACIWFYECEQCRLLLRPLPGDCCVFCSYANIPCPPVQQGARCCDQ